MSGMGFNFLSVLSPVAGTLFGGAGTALNTYLSAQKQQEAAEQARQAAILKNSASELLTLQQQAILQQQAVLNAAQQSQKAQIESSQAKQYFTYAVIGVAAIGGLFILRSVLAKKKK